MKTRRTLIFLAALFCLSIHPKLMLSEASESRPVHHASGYEIYEDDFTRKDQCPDERTCAMFIKYFAKKIGCPLPNLFPYELEVMRGPG